MNGGCFAERIEKRGLKINCKLVLLEGLKKFDAELKWIEKW